MTVSGVSAAQAGPAQASPEQDRLKQATRDFEAVFIQQMLKAMRDTVPDGGLLDAGRSEEMFTALLDEHVATNAADRAHGSLADALYRQLTRKAGA